MTPDVVIFAMVPLALIALMLAIDLRRRFVRRRDALRAAHAAWVRTTPFSVRARLHPEEMAHMSASDIDEFMRPEDMSAVRRDLEELEKTDEGKTLRRAAELRGRRLGIIAAPPPHVVERPADAELSDEEREILALTDARAVRR